MASNRYVVPESDKIWIRHKTGGGKGGFGGIPPQNNPWHRLAEITGPGYLTRCGTRIQKDVQRTRKPTDNDPHPYCYKCWHA